MAKPLPEFTRFIWWMQTKLRGGRQLSDQAKRLRLRVRQKEKAATVCIHYRSLLLLSPRAVTHFTVPWRAEGWVDLGTAVRVCSPRLYIAVAVVINTPAAVRFEPGSSHIAVSHVTARPLRHCTVWIAGILWLDAISARQQGPRCSCCSWWQESDFSNKRPWAASQEEVYNIVKTVSGTP